MLTHEQKVGGPTLAPSSILTPGARLYVARHARGLSISRLAALSWVSRSTIETIESISPAFTLERVRLLLAEALGIAPQAIWPDHDTMKPWWTQKRGQPRARRPITATTTSQPTMLDYFAACQEVLPLVHLLPMLELDVEGAEWFAIAQLESFGGIGDGEAYLVKRGLISASDLQE